MSDLTDLYQEVILDHNRSPRNLRRLEGADHTAQGYNPLCGDKVEIFVRMDGDRIAQVSFEGAGCAISTASASVLTEAVAGLTIDEAEALFRRFHDLVTGEGEDDLSLGKLAVFAGVRDYPTRVKCATLVWHTLKAALERREAPVTTE